VLAVELAGPAAMAPAVAVVAGERESGQGRGEMARMGSGCSARPIWRRGAAMGATACHRASRASDGRPRGGELLLLVGRECTRVGESRGKHGARSGRLVRAG
jgi:hypothetical protein